MKWPLLDVQPGGLQSRQALKDGRSPSPAHIVVSSTPLCIFPLSPALFFLPWFYSWQNKPETSPTFLSSSIFYFFYFEWTVIFVSLKSQPLTHPVSFSKLAYLRCTFELLRFCGCGLNGAGKAVTVVVVPWTARFACNHKDNDNSQARFTMSWNIIDNWPRWHFTFFVRLN